MKDVLFRPFDLTRWFIIGFCAFLATLGETGGAGWNYRYDQPWGPNQPGQDSFNQWWDQMVSYVNDNRIWIIPLVLAGIAFVTAMIVLVIGLSSRGRFMFLDNVATNRAEVVRPWQRFRHSGNSLFRFRLGLVLIGFLLLVPLIGVGGASIFNMVRRDEATAAGIVVSVVTFAATLLLGLILFIVGKLTTDFVVPIMWRRATDWRTGWRQFRGVLGAFPVRFVLYLLFYLLISLVIGLVIVAVVLLTCCTAGCVMAIPYLGTVLLLPILVFLRSYSAYYLAQYGSDFDVFRSDKAGTSPT
jgi:hypothetical protein